MDISVANKGLYDPVLDVELKLPAALSGTKNESKLLKALRELKANKSNLREADQHWSFKIAFSEQIELSDALIEEAGLFILLPCVKRLSPKLSAAKAMKIAPFLNWDSFFNIPVKWLASDSGWAFLLRLVDDKRVTVDQLSRWLSWWRLSLDEEWGRYRDIMSRRQLAFVDAMSKGDCPLFNGSQSDSSCLLAGFSPEALRAALAVLETLPTGKRGSPRTGCYIGVLRGWESTVNLLSQMNETDLIKQAEAGILSHEKAIYAIRDTWRTAARFPDAFWKIPGREEERYQMMVDIDYLENDPPSRALCESVVTENPSAFDPAKDKESCSMRRTISRCRYLTDEFVLSYYDKMDAEAFMWSDQKIGLKLSTWCMMAERALCGEGQPLGKPSAPVLVEMPSVDELKRGIKVYEEPKLLDALVPHIPNSPDGIHRIFQSGIFSPSSILTFFIHNPNMELHKDFMFTQEEADIIYDGMLSEIKQGRGDKAHYTAWFNWIHAREKNMPPEVFVTLDSKLSVATALTYV